MTVQLTGYVDFSLKEDSVNPCDTRAAATLLYIIHLTEVIDDSEITSFKALKKNTSYLVGEPFTMNDFSIEATTERGNTFVLC